MKNTTLQKKANDNVFAKFKNKLTMHKKAGDDFVAWHRKFLTLLQNLGKALLFPIAVLPFAALLNRFGALGVQVATNAGHVHQADWWIATVIQTPGLTVFNNLPIIFAVGVAFGLAKDNRGEAALIGGLFYLILAAFTAEGSLPSLFYKNVLPFTQSDTGAQYSRLFYLPTFDPNTGQITGHTYILDIGVLGGIVSGCLTAYMYNRLKDIKLPQALSFFGGRRFVPMVAGVVSIPVAFIFAVVWPWIQYGLVNFGTQISTGGDAWKVPGAFLYGVINRLAQPFGLHHIINTFLWFQLPVSGPKVDYNGNVLDNGQIFTVNGDITAFNNQIANAGTFQSGYFPLYMGGEPGIAIAMLCSIRNKTKRKETALFLAGVASVAFLTGIDDPLVFSFLFLSPLLWFIYAFFTGIMAAIVIAMDIHLGFGFSAGFIDYVISFAQSWGISKYTGHVSGNPLFIFPLAAAAFGLYFITFLPIIKRLNILTPGREEDYLVVDDKERRSLKYLFSIRAVMPNLVDKPEAKVLAANAKANKVKGVKTANKASETVDVSNANIISLKGDVKYKEMARRILVALGGNANLTSVGNCATRLRLNVVDNQKIDKVAVKKAGGIEVILLGKTAVQIIIGTDVEFVANFLKELTNK